MVKLEDDSKKETGFAFLRILLEEEKQMAKRNKEMIVERKLVPQQAEAESFFKHGCF